MGIALGIGIGIGMSGWAGGAPAAPVNTALPAITGTPTVDETLTVSDGTWTIDMAKTYQWRRDGTPIVGATANSYLLVEDDEGADIDCGVTNGGVTAYADAVGPVASAYSYGTELASNGASAWTPNYSASLADDDDMVDVTDTEGDYPTVTQALTLESGQPYEFSIDVDGGTTSPPWGVPVVELRSSGNPTIGLGAVNTGITGMSGIIIAPAASCTLWVYAEAGDFAVGNLSVRKVTSMPSGLIPVPETQYAASSMTKPSVGSWVEFDSFGTDILRLNSAGLRNTYSTNQSFSADDSKVFLGDHGSYPYPVYNTDDGTLYRNVAQAQAVANTLNFFDPVDPQIMWGRSTSQSRIYRYNVVTNATAETITIPGSYAGLSFGQGEGSISADGRYIILVGPNSGGNRPVMAYDVVGESVVRTISTATTGFDNAQISHSGDYIIIGRSNGHHVYSRATGSLLYTYGSGNAAEHMDVGYRADGDECFFRMDSDWTQGVSVRLSDGHVRVEMRAGPFSGAHHVSGRCIGKPGWVLITAYYVGGNASKVLFREHYMLKLDGKQTIERWGQAMFGTEGSYDYQARGCVSPSGNFMVFNSGWNASDGSDAYLVKRPT